MLLTVGIGSYRIDLHPSTGGNNYIAPNAQALQDAFEEIALTLPVVFTD